MKTQIKSCETCLYMATHEKVCDGCLWTKDDYKLIGKDRPPMRYLNYQEGNWMDRVIQAEIDGKQNIVIGGQGEAEVNTKWTPQETSHHLHYVSEQCGYVTGHLSFNRDDSKVGLKISTSEGWFHLIWDSKTNKLLSIENLQDSKGWSWKNENPFRQAS